MSFNGSGTFVVNTAGQPVVPNTVISATAFNALTNDLANGLSTCITKDGQTTPTANIPMGNNKITGLAPGTSGTDAANLSQVQGSTAKLLQSVTGTDTITAAMVPALTSYSAGQMFYFVAAGDNTGAVTINIDSLGAKSVTRDGSTALVAGDITNGKVVVIVYDGTRFQLLNSNAFTNLYVSGNLGVGTASPAFKLQVVGTQRIEKFGAGYEASMLSFSTLTETSAIYRLGMATGGNFTIGRSDTSTTDLTLDSSGNLGLGVTPSAWASTFKAYQVENQSLWSTAAGNGYLSNNAFFNTSNQYIYRNTGYATEYIQSIVNGSHSWFTAPSGTAGNAISFTQAMTLDASGNLGIGTASPSYRLDVVDAGGNALRFGTSTVQMGGFVSAGLPYLGTISNHSLALMTNSVERMRITNAGNIVAGASVALATTATDGFLYVPTCAGTPTGTPTAITGMAPIVVNTTNNKLYFYSGGAWRDAGP